LGGREVKLQRSTSAGQFGAAIDVYPENWTWFIAPLPKGSTTFRVEINVPVENVSVGVLRARLHGREQRFPRRRVGAVFPTFRPERRAWSQALQPLRSLVDVEH
jgi:hypothetical protein